MTVAVPASMPASPVSRELPTVVFLAYVTARAHTLFSFRLYLPTVV